MENYEKKYKEALERARALNEGKTTGAFGETVCEYIFPELKESEDEKIRKDLIRFIKNWKDPNNIGRPHDFPTLTRNVEQCDRYIAWLEKQKEFVSADFDDVWKTADCDELTAPLEKYSKDAIKEMCHAWYDKGIELERKNWLEREIDWLKSLKDRIQHKWKPNDEHMKLLREVQQALLGKDCHNRFVNFMCELKKLKEE